MPINRTRISVMILHLFDFGLQSAAMIAPSKPASFPLFHRTIFSASFWTCLLTTESILFGHSRRSHFVMQMFIQDSEAHHQFNMRINHLLCVCVLFLRKFYYAFFFVFYSAFIIKYGYDNNDNLQESNVNAIFLYCCFFFSTAIALSLHL